jgi:hypothetical protein
MLKNYVQKVRKPKTKDELLAAIKAYWAGVTPELCQKFISHLKKVVPAVVENEGGPSGF